MARPRNKRGFRPIVVEDTSYRWRLNTNSGLLEINLADSHNQRLAVDFGWFDKWLYPPGDKQPPAFSPQVVTPGFVKEAILFGLQNGWKPNEKGESVHLIYADDTFALAEESEEVVKNQKAI